jgi:NAD(P)H-hydrate epimerase
MLLTPQEMRETEEAAFATGADAESLMDRAGEGIADVVSQFFPSPGLAVVFAATGHNGGDGFVAARHLLARGWEIRVRLLAPSGEIKPLAKKKLGALPPGSIVVETGALPSNMPTITLDGLLGIGATGGLRGRFREACDEINALRNTGGATTFAIDIPTGLDGATGEADPAAVVADVTVTVGQAKTGLVADAAVNFVGRLALVPLDELDNPVAGDRSVAVVTPRTVTCMLPRRNADTHKGQAGRIALVAGSPGMVGAAALCASAAVRAGAGLVFLYVKPDAYPTAASLARPEVMVRPVDSYREILSHPHDALGIGPGLGRAADQEVADLIASFPGPAVVDADALNILADGRLAVLKQRPAPTLLTPHPGEMARLEKGEVAGGTDNGRITRATAFVADRKDVTLLLKGARTVIATRGETTLLNPTGHPGMATGGMGDVLTGIATTLAAGCPHSQAMHLRAGLAAWIAGRAAERAVSHGGQSIESTVAGDVIAHLGGAFTDLRSGAF